MSNDLAIQGRQPISGALPVTVQAKASTAAPVAAAKPSPLYVNPNFHFDPTTGFVVIEFHNDAGKLTNSIPTQRQLDAYRANRVASPDQSAPPKANGEAASG